MNWFSKRDKDSKERLALPPKEPRFPESLLEAFKDAAFGYLCQTSRFRPANSAENETLVWRKAVRMPGNRDGKNWSVFEIRQKAHQYLAPAKPVNTENQTSREVARELSFFDAIENLALFEQSPFTDPGVDYAKEECEPSASAGGLYFKDLAAIEGIIFDLEDMPHPTVNGEIVTNGTFAQAEINKLGQDKPKAEQGGNVSLPQIDTAEVLGFIGKETSWRISRIETLKELHLTKKTLKDFSDYMGLYCSLVQQYLASDFQYENYNHEAQKQQTGASFKIHSYIDSDFDRRYELKFNCESLHYTKDLYWARATGKVIPPFNSPDMKKVNEGFKELNRWLFNELENRAKNALSDLEHNHKDLSKHLKGYLTELSLIRNVIDSSREAKVIKEQSLKGSYEDRDFNSLNSKRNGMLEQLRFLNPEARDDEVKVLMERLETFILSNTPPDPAQIPWDRYNNIAAQLDQQARQYQKLIAHEWGGKGIDPQAIKYQLPGKKP